MVQASKDTSRSSIYPYPYCYPYSSCVVVPRPRAMTTSDKFCLKWNDFRKNVTTAFGSLREDVDFGDVTLACEDGQQVEAHKVILAASSPFFRRLLIRNKHSHPLVYMRGINYVDLLSILDFLYYGEANIYQENLDNFLKIAEEIQLKGLTEGEGDPQCYEESDNSCERNERKPLLNHIMNEVPMDKGEALLDDKYVNTYNASITVESERAVAITTQTATGDFKELDEQIKLMITQGQTLWKDGTRKNHACTVCGKEANYSNIKNHIESSHMEGVSIPCNFCDKTFRSRKSLGQHNCHSQIFLSSSI